MPFWNPFARKKHDANTVPAVPDVEEPSAWDADPGLLLQNTASQPSKPPPKSSPGASTSTGAGVSAGGMLHKYFGIGKPNEHMTLDTDTETHSPPTTKTLQKRFKSQKAIAGIGMLLSMLVLVTSFFHSGVEQILNIAVSITGFLSCAMYFFASTINIGKRFFFWSSLLCMGFGVAIFIVNVVWLVGNATSVSTWLVIPFTVIALLAIACQVGIVGVLAYRGWVHSRAERASHQAQAKAQEFAAMVGKDDDEKR